MNQRERAEAVALARDLMTATLHGPIPTRTTMRLASLVLEMVGPESADPDTETTGKS